MVFKPFDACWVCNNCGMTGDTYSENCVNVTCPWCGKPVTVQPKIKEGPIEGPNIEY